MTDCDFLIKLEKIIEKKKQLSAKQSYTASLYMKGINKIAQKFGEESVEVLVAALNEQKEQVIYESADLLYHWLLLLQKRDIKLSDVIDELKRRNHSKLDEINQ
jgi:phosphoribosyl-ATP pyrophosphohydrolase